VKYVASICVVLALSATAHGQQPPPRPQVRVQLKIVEVSLTKVQHMGFDPAILSGNPDTKHNTNQASGNDRSFPGISSDTEAEKLVETLRKQNLVRVLAEPTLVAISGRTVRFVSGDKLPIPKPQKDGSMAIGYRHGTEVEVTSEVLGDKVHLAVHAQLSELDNGHSVRVGKETMPGIRERALATRAELKSGQTLVIRGLSQVRVEASVRDVSYLSSVPYVGAIFGRVVEKERNEIAMLAFVRPEILTSSATGAKTELEPGRNDHSN
jgi:pilus assembly protein CpaC